MSVTGIDFGDVDTPNAEGDYDVAARAGCRFAVFRHAWGTYLDKVADREQARAKRAGIVTGRYLFLRSPLRGQRPAEPEDQVDRMADTYKPEPDELPPALDIEFPGSGRPDTGLTAAQLLDWVVRAQRRMRARFGAAPLDYTSQRVWHEDLGDLASPDFADSPAWLARYPFASGIPAVLDADALAWPPVPPVFGDSDACWVHQYQGDATRFPGFAHQVDVNRFRLLAPGARGSRVAWVQRRLGLAQTATLDDPTTVALRAMQAAAGLDADAVIGPMTFARLAWMRPAGGRAAAISAAIAKLTEANRELVAALSLPE